MNTSKFKYVVGEAKENEVCDIRLFCDIDEYTANSFNSEFLWVESYIKPSKIWCIRALWYEYLLCNS